MNKKKFSLTTEQKEYLKAQEPTFLGTAGIFNGQQTFICPCCQSGSGHNRTGLSRIPHKSNYHCFACGETGDVLYFAQKYYDTDFKTALQKLCDYYGITPETDVSMFRVPTNDDADLDIDIPLIDQMEYYNKVRANLDPTYLEQRGISKETQEHFWVGTDLEWINPNSKNGAKYPSPRCIIPTSRFSYLARDMRSDLKDYQKRFSKIKYGATKLFNTGLKGSKADIVYIVEGEIDAMSIYDVTKGAIQAIGLGSTSMWRHLYDEIDFHEHLKNKTFVLMLDNDEPGQKTQQKIIEAFGHYNVPYVVQEYPKEYNDPNEYLCKDRQGFTKMIKETYIKNTHKDIQPGIELGD